MNEDEMREALADVLNDAGLGCEEYTPGDYDSGCPDCEDLLRYANRILPVVRRIAAEELRAAAEWLCDEADDGGASLLDSTGREMISGPAFRNVEWAAQSLCDRADALDPATAA